MKSVVSSWMLALAICASAACDRTPAPAVERRDDTAAATSVAGNSRGDIGVASVAGDVHGDIGVASVAGESHVARVGDEAAAQLNGWYQRRDRDCGGPTLPAFLCSGVTFRATDTKAAFLPWDPSPNGTQKGGISASWIRIDANIPNSTLPNGFIFFPSAEAPPGSVAIEVLCAFPFDGNTWMRPTLQGCGPVTGYPTSAPCQDIQVHTAEQWLTHYFSPGYSRHSHQCGWDVRTGSPDTADRFEQNIRARAGLQWEQWQFTTENVLKTWSQGLGATLPIHSFFYRAGDAAALNNARYDQERYFNLYGKALPVIALSLPKSQQDGEASFTYNEADQKIPLPEHVANARPGVVEASGDNGRLLRIDDFYRRDNVTVRVPRYLDMAVGQVVGIRWAGTVAYTAARPVAKVGAMDFSVPRVEVVDSIGRTVPVTFSVKRGTAPEEVSARLDLAI